MKHLIRLMRGAGILVCVIAVNFMFAFLLGGIGWLVGQLIQVVPLWGWIGIMFTGLAYLMGLKVYDD